MKVSFLTMFIFLSFNLTAQDFSDARHYLDSAERRTYRTDNMLVSYKGLDAFFARKIAYYLSGSKDVSLFENYAILTPGDDKVFYGHNWTFHTPQGRLNSLLTLGANLNYANSFGAIVDNGKFQGTDASINLKFTKFNLGKIKFDKHFVQTQLESLVTRKGAQKRAMDTVRRVALAKIKIKMVRDSTDLANIRNNILDNVIRNPDLSSDFSDLNDGYKKDFETEEAKALEKSNSHNKTYTSWWYASLTVPLGKNEYIIASDIASAFNDAEVFPLKFEAGYNRVTENSKSTFFWNVGVSAYQTNSVLLESMDKLSFSEYKFRGGVDTLKLLQLKPDDVYIGDYNKFWGAGVNAQIVYFPSSQQKIGISLYAEQLFGINNSFNGRIGIPIKQKGKGEDNIINFELQGKFFDLGGKIQPHKAVFEKFSLGLTVGLPFGSVKY